MLDRITITEIALAGLKKYNAPNEILDILYLKSLNLGIISMLRKEKYEYISLERKQELFNSLKEYLEKFPSDTLYQAKFDKLIYFDKVLKAKTQEENISFGALYFFSPAKAISVIVIRSSTAFASVEDSVIDPSLARHK